MSPPPPSPSPACTCGYDMAGLALPGPCPECGATITPAGPSSRPTPLPIWLRLLILIWSLCLIDFAYAVKRGIDSGNGGATRATVWYASTAIAVAAIALAFLSARRRRIEVAAAIMTGLGLYVFAMFCCGALV